jgi:cardiolipin synthase
VIESLLRLMHAGWIEITQSSEGIVFRSNEQGKEAAKREELPNLQRPTTRSMNLMIDQVTGTVYRRREMPLFEKHVLNQRANRERLVWLEPRTINITDQVKAIVSTLFDEDERFVAMEDSGERLVDRFGVASVRDGRLEGFTPRAPDELGYHLGRCQEGGSAATDSVVLGACRARARYRCGSAAEPHFFQQ